MEEFIQKFSQKIEKFNTVSFQDPVNIIQAETKKRKIEYFIIYIRETALRQIKKYLSKVSDPKIKFMLENLYEMSKKALLEASRELLILGRQTCDLYLNHLDDHLLAEQSTHMKIISALESAARLGLEFYEYELARSYATGKIFGSLQAPHLSKGRTKKIGIAKLRVLAESAKDSVILREARALIRDITHKPKSPLNNYFRPEEEIKVGTTIDLVRDPTPISYMEDETFEVSGLPENDQISDTQIEDEIVFESPTQLDSGNSPLEEVDCSNPLTEFLANLKRDAIKVEPVHGRIEWQQEELKANESFEGNDGFHVGSFRRENVSIHDFFADRESKLSEDEGDSTHAFLAFGFDG